MVGAIRMKCDLCPRRPEDTCTGETDPAVCSIALRRQLAGVPTHRDDLSRISSRTLALIECCPARLSFCASNCQPAICTAAGKPLSVSLLFCRDTCFPEISRPR